MAGPRRLLTGFPLSPTWAPEGGRLVRRDWRGRQEKRLAAQRSETAPQLRYASCSSAKGLLKYVRHVLSIEEVKHWKPHCEPYLFAARSDTGRAQSPRSPRSGRLGHARRSQLVTGWISVLEKRYQPAIRPSRRERDSLDEVVAALVSGRWQPATAHWSAASIQAGPLEHLSAAIAKRCHSRHLTGKRSAKANPSRWTVSPTLTGMDAPNIGPAETNV